MFVSATRLRLRSALYLLPFFLATTAIQRQANSAPGNNGVLVRKTAGLAFWTLTFWSDRGAMEAFRSSGAHRKAMPKLRRWCDQAAVGSWETSGDDRPDWHEAARALKASGRLSRLDRPSPEHAAGEIIIT